MWMPTFWSSFEQKFQPPGAVQSELWRLVYWMCETQAENSFTLSHLCSFSPALCPWITFWVNAIPFLVTLRQQKKKKVLWLLSGPWKPNPVWQINSRLSFCHFGLFRVQQSMMGESAGSPASLLPTHLPQPSSKQFGTLLGGLGGEEGQNRSRMAVVTGGVRWHRGHSPRDTLVSSSGSHLTAAPEAGDATSGCLLASPPSQHLCAQ